MAAHLQQTSPAIAHPCNKWAIAAGYDSWVAALDAMKNGRVCVGSTHAIQSASKSMFGFHIFMDVINKNGLHTVALDEGAVIAVGYEKDFPVALDLAQEVKFAS